MANLVKLYTIHGPIWIDTEQILRPRTLYTIYTSRGNKLSEVARTKAERERASYGVHRDNLFASPELAEADFERIHAAMACRGIL